MRTSTKVKRLLDKHTIGLSLSVDGWHLTVINVERPSCRNNFNAASLGKVVDKAFKFLPNTKDATK